MFGEIRNQQREKLDYTIHSGEARSDFIVIIGHGVTGHKDRSFVVALAEGRRAVATPADGQAVDSAGSTTVSLLDD